MKKVLALILFCTISFIQSINSQNLYAYDVTYMEFTTNMSVGVNFSGIILKISESPDVWIIKAYDDNYSGLPLKLKRKDARGKILTLIDESGYLTLQLNLESYKINMSYNGIYNNASITRAVAGPGLPRENDNAQIIAQHSDKFLTVQENNFNNGVQLFQSTQNYVSNQNFKFKLTDDGYYNILIGQKYGNQKAIDLSGGGTYDGTPIQQWDYVNNENQKFLLVPVDREYFKIVTFNGKVLDIFGGEMSTADGIPLHQWTYWGGKNQHFRIQQYYNDGSSFRRE